jgi:putative addiction module killer protein
MQYELTILETNEGKTPFIDWLEKLDIKTQARINNRISRIKSGNFGDFKSIEDKVFELRLFFGSGYRIYYGIIEERIVLAISGGDKANQRRDIQKAKKLWATYFEEEKKNG